MDRPRGWEMLKRLMRDQRLHRDTPTAVSILLFTESSKPSGIFPKKMPPRMTFKWKHLNRNRSRLRPVHCVLITMHACGFSQGGTQPWEISCQCADHQRWLLLLRQQKALSGFVLRGHLALSPNLGQASANRKGYLYRNLGFSKLFRALCFVRSGGPSTRRSPLTIISSLRASRERLPHRRWRTVS